ncbi:MAG TPA: EVE domain-containing protein [Streptosporangiaceae bacterium]|jgi:hypothetical protein
MTEWIFQGNPQRFDLHAALNASRQRAWHTPRYRDLAAPGDRVWLQIVGRDHPGIYYVATVLSPTYEEPGEWSAGSSRGRWRTDIRFDYRIEPPLLRSELLEDVHLGSFRPFRGFQGSTVPVPPEIAGSLARRAEPRLVALESGDHRESRTSSGDR